MPRLQAGFKHFKQTHMKKIIEIMSKIEIFNDFSKEEVK